MTQLIKWEDSTQLQEVKKLFAPDLTQDEFQTFVGIGKATKLNPFLREIWAVKYGKQAASIFIWRDWYRKSAQSSEQYDYHLVDAVYMNDNFEIENGEVKHKYNFKDRWQLVWAYCLVRRKWASQPVYNYVDLIEYYNGNRIIKNWEITNEIKKTQYGPMKETIWDTKPATMIKKVAEAQWLRGTFQELFAWTYDESEDWNTPKVQKVQEPVIDEKKQEENYKKYYDKMYAVKSIEELQQVFVELNAERKKDKDLINKVQIDELTKVKNEIKETLTSNDIQEWETEEIQK